MEMEDNKQICRLCLDIVPGGFAEAIGEKQRTILKVLLINVDLHVTDDPVACSGCLDELQSGFAFKSACLHTGNCISTSVDADFSVDIKEVSPGEMKDMAMANVDLENRQICRLCRSLIADEALDCNMDLKDIIENCLPELEIHTVHEPLVCELCFSRLKKLNEFMKTCQEVERRINKYCQAAADHANPISVSLDDLLKFKDNTISGLVKEECSNFDSNVLEDIKDIATIECEEIHIKSELESGDEMGDSSPSGACSGKSDPLTSKGMEHFACPESTYKTDRKFILARHMVTHKDKPEVEMQKCGNCEFETGYKRIMIHHMLTRHGIKVKKKLKCDKCSYEAEYKCHLRRHKLIHIDKSEVEMHKCEKCEFETRWKNNLKTHMLKACVRRDTKE